jgi:dethiobiotin synthetase
MHGLFITGSDTGVGKTFVTAAITRILRKRGHDPRVCKPVATGARWRNGRWVSDDTCLLAESSGDTPDAVTFWTFAAPAAPSVAARVTGVTLDLEEIVAAVSRRTEPGRLLLIEGVGGLLCPLTDRATVADLVSALGLPLLVVVRRSLGTLNHTLLTLEVSRRRKLPVAGVVVNETTPVQGIAEETCIEELRRHMDVPLLAVVGHQADFSEEPPALEAVDWLQLAGLLPSAVPSGSDQRD